MSINIDTDSYNELNQMVRCVQLSFRFNKTQKEIADILKITPSQVSRVLKRAHTEGIYRVEFNFPPLLQLAADLADKYGLADAVVIPTGISSEQIKIDLGQAGARYFEKRAQNGISVGLSCGLTLFHLVSSLKAGHFSDLSLYPLASENTLKAVDIAPNTLVGIMTSKYRPRVTGYALPSQTPNKSARIARGASEQRGDADAADVYKAACNVDIALVGIGGVDHASPGFCALATRANHSIKDITGLGVVGEFNYQPINEGGELVDKAFLKPLLARSVHVSVNILRDLAQQFGKQVIGIGGGGTKVKAIHATLMGKLCNILITDQATARSLLGK